MALLDNLKKDFEEDQKQLDTPKGRKWIRYGAYGLLAFVVLLIATCVAQSVVAPRQASWYGDQPPYTGQPYMQPQVVQQGNSGGDMLLAAGAGALAGYVVGQSRMPDGSIYQGTPAQRTVIQRTYIVRQEAAKSGTRNNAVSANNVSNLPNPKVKNPGDAAAEIERQKMKAEEAKRSAEEARKAEIKSRLATPSKPSGFASFSKSASSRSGKR